MVTKGLRSESLNVVAAKRVVQGGAELVHPGRAESSEPAPEPLLQDGDGVVQIDGAGPFHAIAFVQKHLGCDSANG